MFPLPWREELGRFNINERDNFVRTVLTAGKINFAIARGRQRTAADHIKTGFPLVPLTGQNSAGFDLLAAGNLDAGRI